MRHLRLVLLLPLAAALLSSCGFVKHRMRWLKPSSEKKEGSGEAKDIYLGVVESVNPEQKFVLIRMDMRMAVAAGTKLDVRSPQGGRSVLVVTPERKMNFLSADISEGIPAAGDIVLLPPQAAAAPELSAPGTASAAPGIPPADPVPGVPPDEAALQPSLPR